MMMTSFFRFDLLFHENGILGDPCLAVYVVGRQQAYLDRNVVFVQDDLTWVPTSLNALLDNA